MKILYVTQYYPPEMGAPGARASELARYWVKDGHEVTVLTGFPNHPTGVVPPEYRARMRRLVAREKIDGVNVVRTWLWPLPNRKAYERMLNYSSFCLSAAITGLFTSRPDVVIASSPQLLVGLSGWWLSFCKRVPFVFEVRDLWPESLVAVGMGKEHSLLHWCLGKLAGFLYRRCNEVVVVTPAFQDHLVAHWQMPKEKIAIVQNGVETDLFSPQNAGALKDKLDLQGRFVICYIGTMGMAHGLETVVEAADILRTSLPEAMFLLVGEGAEKERIIELARSRGLDNLRFVDQQPRERIPDYIDAADLCLVLLKKAELFKTVIPTKMLEFMSCARPIVLGVDGQARKIVEEAHAGVFVEPENPQALARTVIQLAGQPELRDSLGRNGRSCILQNFSRQSTAAAYLGVLQAVTQKNCVRGTAANISA